MNREGCIVRREKNPRDCGFPVPGSIAIRKSRFNCVTLSMIVNYLLKCIQLPLRSSSYRWWHHCWWNTCHTLVPQQMRLTRVARDCGMPVAGPTSIRLSRNKCVWATMIDQLSTTEQHFVGNIPIAWLNRKHKWSPWTILLGPIFRNRSGRPC